MIQQGTVLHVADNSGAKTVRCIKVLGGSHRYSASVCDVIVVSVQDAIPNGKVKSGEIHYAVILGTKSTIKGCDIKFDRNIVALLNKQLEPIGTRILGPVFRGLRDKFLKIISLAQEVI